MKFQFRYILIAVALCVCSASLALGASVTITSSGGGSFAVQGDSMNGVYGIDLTIGYDTSVLTSPSVSWGSLVSGATSIANTTTIPGTIRIAIIQTTPLSGSGPIAAISFATYTGSAGITSLSAKIDDGNKALVPAQATIAPGAASTAVASGTSEIAPGLITTAGVPFSQPASPQDTATAAATAAATTPPPLSTGLGTVALPADIQSKDDTQPAESKSAHPPEPAAAAETTKQQMKQPAEEKTSETIEPVDVKQTVYTSVLDRFRTHQGEKTPENLIKLFTNAVSPSIRQEPAIVISDGKATARITVDHSDIKGASTNFALTGAKLVSLKKGVGSDSWVLDALPQANSLKAAVIIMNSLSVIEFPLTVVPPAAAVSAKKSEFAAFLKDSGAKVPKHDLNGDGSHDYLDDFIYTAHYLINSTAAKPHTRQ